MLLKLGMRNGKVTEIQRRLALLGYTVSVDGIFGFGTLKALKKFQLDNKMEVNGIIDSMVFEPRMQKINSLIKILKSKIEVM